MKMLTTLGYLVVTLIGVAAISVDTWSNVAFVGFAQPDLVAAVVIVAIATATALTAAGVAFRRFQVGIAAGLFIAFICGAIFSLTATLDRVASLRDAKLHTAHVANAKVIEARRALRSAEALAIAEAKNGGCGTRCRALQRRVDELREKLSAAGTEREVDSLGTRVAALLPFVTPKQVNTYQPMALPVALFLFGNLLTAFGLSGLSGGAQKPHQVIDVEAVEIHPVAAALQSQSRPVTNREIAALLGVSEATAHRYVDHAVRSGIAAKERDGRAMAIRLIA